MPSTTAQPLVGRPPSTPPITPGHGFEAVYTGGDLKKEKKLFGRCHVVDLKYDVEDDFRKASADVIDKITKREN